MTKIISNMIEAHIFREAQSAIEFLLLKRSENVIYPGLWQMVNGKVKENEKAYETALREINEETGLKPVKLWTAPNINPFYSHENDFIQILPVFAALIKKDSEVILSSEHSEFKWVNTSKAKQMLPWPGHRKSVEIITQYFTKELKYLNFIEIKF